jgi:hypothetical protein
LLVMLGVGLYVVGGRFFSSLGITLSIYLKGMLPEVRRKSVADMVKAKWPIAPLTRMEGTDSALD